MLFRSQQKGPRRAGKLRLRPPGCKDGKQVAEHDQGSAEGAGHVQPVRGNGAQEPQADKHPSQPQQNLREMPLPRSIKPLDGGGLGWIDDPGVPPEGDLAQEEIQLLLLTKRSGKPLSMTMPPSAHAAAQRDLARGGHEGQGLAVPVHFDAGGQDHAVALDAAELRRLQVRHQDDAPSLQLPGDNPLPLGARSAADRTSFSSSSVTGCVLYLRTLRRFCIVFNKPISILPFTLIDYIVT